MKARAALLSRDQRNRAGHSLLPHLLRLMVTGLLVTAGAQLPAVANIDLATLEIYGSGRSGGPDELGGNTFLEGASSLLTATNPNTFLYNPNLTWQDSSNTSVTYTTTITGGLEEVAPDGSINVKGRVSHSHDAVNPADTVRFGTAGVNLRVQSDTPFSVSVEVTVVNGLADPAAEYYTGADVYLGSDFSNFVRNFFYDESSAATDTASGTTVLPPGSYNLDIYGSKWVDDNLLGGTLTLDFCIRLQSVPGIPMQAFLNNGSVGSFLTVTPGTLDPVIGMAAGEGPEFEVAADGKIYASVSRNAQALNEYSPTGSFLRTVILDPAGSFYFTGMEITETTFYAAQSTQGASAAPSTFGIIDTTAGTFTPIGPMTGTSSPTTGLAWDGATMFAVTGGQSSPQLFSVNLSTGAATPIGSGVGVTAPQLTGLEFGCDGVLYALDRFGGANLDGTLYSVDPATGVFTPLGDFGVTLAQGAVNAIATGPLIPTTFPFEVTTTRNTANRRNFDFEWTGRNGKYYKLVSSPDLTLPVTTWPVWDGHVNLVGCGEEITLTNITTGNDLQRFFAVVESDTSTP